MKLTERIAGNFGVIGFWGRNAKVLVFTEALWGIPIAWVFFYQSIFMKSLGMSEVFIGFSAMLPLAFQILLPMLGGYLADKFGRKRVLMLFDGTGWLGSMATWFLAKEPWHIIVAVVFYGLSTTTFGVWETLLVEDTKPIYRAGMYGMLQTIYIVGGMLTPIAGMLVSLYGIEQGCRYLFLIMFVTMAVMFAIRQVYLRESEIGEMLSSPERLIRPGSGGYAETFRIVTAHKRLRLLFVLWIVGAIQYPLVNTYKPLYLSDLNGLALDEVTVSLIPMASSVPSLLALLLIVPRLRDTHIKGALLFSYLCGILGLLALILAPKASLTFAIVSAVLDSARFVAVMSILRVFLVNTIDGANPLARAKIMSLLTAFSAVASSPAPLVGGYLYTASTILPFVLAAIFLAISAALLSKV